MKIKKQNQASTGSAPIGDEPISAANYLKRFNAFAVDRGWFVIRSPERGLSKDWAEMQDTPAQWNAWMRWFARRSIPTIFARKHGVAAVPTEWPESFDSACPASDRIWRPPYKSSSTFVDRERVRALFAELQGKIGFPAHFRGPNNFQKEADRLAAVEALAARAEEWKSPVALSPFGRKAMGLGMADEPTPDFAP